MVNKIICLCTSSNENLFTYKISCPKLLLLLSYALHEKAEEEQEFVKIMFYLYFIPGAIFSFYFLHAVTFLHVLHLDVLNRQIEIETESENCYVWL